MVILQKIEEWGVLWHVPFASDKTHCSTLLTQLCQGDTRLLIFRGSTLGCANLKVCSSLHPRSLFSHKVTFSVLVFRAFYCGPIVRTEEFRCSWSQVLVATLKFQFLWLTLRPAEPGVLFPGLIVAHSSHSSNVRNGRIVTFVTYPPFVVTGVVTPFAPTIVSAPLPSSFLRQLAQ